MEPAELADVHVLLVDDDAEWVATASRELSAVDDAFTVLTATSGPEALAVFEREPVDCVVCDYRMPEMDGIEVLERIREVDETAPFVLVTGSGSEGVASRAISADVTDYFVKQPGTDQSGPLVARIRSAVAADRTREALSAARRQFRALFENVPDPVAVVDDDGVSRLNDAFERTFGVHESEAVGRSVDDLLDGPGSLGDDGDGVVELSTGTGGDREFLVRRLSLGEEGEGYAFTDVTENRERQRDLERALELDVEVRELFLSATTRAELERAFCETVVDPNGRVLAVLAEPSRSGGLERKASAGPVDADDVPWAEEGSPMLVASAERSTVHRPGRAGDGWSDRAAAAGVGSAVAVPIQVNGVSGGVFGLFSAESGGVSEEDAERVEDLVRSFGDAVHLVERMSVLSADSVVRVQLSVDGEGPLAVAAGDDADLSVDAIRSAEGIASMYVDAEQSVADDVGERLAADDRVDEVERVVEGETTRFRVSVSGTTFPGVVVDNGGSVHSLAVDADGYDATVDVGPSGDASRIVDAVEDRFDRATVRSIRSHERTDSTLTKGHLSTLTEKQRTTLETAYAEGYFESPRERSAEEIADSMSIAGSTFLQHLRTAERKLLGSVISPDEGEPDR